MYFSSAEADKKKLRFGILAEIDPGMKNLIYTFHLLKQIKILHLWILAEIDPGMKKPHI